MKRILLYIFLVALFFISCREEAPVQVDGNAEIRTLALWDTSTVDSVHHFIPLANAKMILTSEYGAMVKYTDGNGYMLLNGIPSAIYQISARGVHPNDPNILIVGNVKNVEIKSGTIVTDTIYAKPVSSTGIAINELYVAGPVNNIYFFYDQYIELYNSSDETKYLDGMNVFRVSGTRALCSDWHSPQLGNPGSDWGNDGSIDGITFAFKFPGKPGGHQYPFPSHTFLVLAQDAANHKRETVPTSIDLSHADWEFVNQYSAVDFDNPNVPNLSNMLACKTTEFMISLTSDIIIIADGTDSVLVDGIDVNTILDGVEYQSSGTKKITLDDRVDKGWVQSAPKYSGRSMERREPGIDTNDGTLDWIVIPHPTPGYQH